MGDHSPTDLYRFFDSAGQLLYVGISLSAAARASQHRAEKPWWGDVARMDVEHYDNRTDAARAELTAIKTERPLYNVVGNNGAAAPSSRTHYDKCLPIPFDARFMSLEEHENIVNAIQVVAQRLDRADRDYEDAPSRGEFVHTINGLARSAVYGDCCDQCDEIRNPVALELRSPESAKCYYVCRPCRRMWTCGWAVDISWMATI